MQRDGVGDSKSSGECAGMVEAEKHDGIESSTGGVGHDNRAEVMRYGREIIR